MHSNQKGKGGEPKSYKEFKRLVADSGVTLIHKQNASPYLWGGDEPFCPKGWEAFRPTMSKKINSKVGTAGVSAIIQPCMSPEVEEENTYHCLLQLQYTVGTVHSMGEGIWGRQCLANFLREYMDRLGIPVNDWHFACHVRHHKYVLPPGSCRPDQPISTVGNNGQRPGTDPFVSRIGELDSSEVSASEEDHKGDLTMKPLWMKAYAVTDIPCLGLIDFPFAQIMYCPSSGQVCLCIGLDLVSSCFFPGEVTMPGKNQEEAMALNTLAKLHDPEKFPERYNDAIEYWTKRREENGSKVTVATP